MKNKCLLILVFLITLSCKNTDQMLDKFSFNSMLLSTDKLIIKLYDTNKVIQLTKSYSKTFEIKKNYSVVNEKKIESFREILMMQKKPIIAVVQYPIILSHL